MKDYVIYGIFVAGEKYPFYIGYTDNLERRQYQHLNQPKQKVGEAIRRLQVDGVAIHFVVLEKVHGTKEDALEREDVWIRSARTYGANLVNGTGFIDGRGPVSLNIRPSVAERIKVYAAMHDCKMGEVADRALTEWLDAHE